MLQGFSYKMLCCPVTASNFLNILLLETFCMVAVECELGIRVFNSSYAALVVKREIDLICFSAS